MLPDFSQARSLAEIQSLLAIAARSIMIDHELVYNGRRRNITAIELYLHNEVWPDCTVHQSSTQLKSGRWYVHSYQNGNFRPPRRSGIDITAGSIAANGKKTHVGLLVRELDYVDGPAKALQAIVRQDQEDKTKTTWSSAEISSLTNINSTSILTGPLTLEHRRNELNDPTFWIGPRKLPTKRPEAQPFKNAPLRIATWKTTLHRGRMELFTFALQ